MPLFQRNDEPQTGYQQGRAKKSAEDGGGVCLAVVSLAERESLGAERADSENRNRCSARELMVALWRYVIKGEAIEGAIINKTIEA